MMPIHSRLENLCIRCGKLEVTGGKTFLFTWHGVFEDALFMVKKGSRINEWRSRRVIDKMTQNSILSPLGLTCLVVTYLIDPTYHMWWTFSLSWFKWFLGKVWLHVSTQKETHMKKYWLDAWLLRKTRQNHIPSNPFKGLSLAQII